jgi:ABC-type Na+ efflux pump permease subunit
MSNILSIAKREFLATVATRAFIIGLFVLPTIIALSFLIGPRLFNFRNYQVKGEVLVIDPTGQVTPELRKNFDPVRIAARRKEEMQKALGNAPEEIQKLADNSANAEFGSSLTPIPDLRVLTRPPGSDIEEEKKWLNTQPKGIRSVCSAQSG